LPILTILKKRAVFLFSIATDGDRIESSQERNIMATLFEETTIKGMTLRNRLVRSATWEGMCDEAGRPTDKLTDCYRDLTRGEIGLTITGYAYVRPEGKQHPGKMGIYTDDFASEMRSLTDAVHADGGSICIQLVHAGGQTDSANAGRQPLAPSAVRSAQFPEVPQELTKQDIEQIVTAFGDAARRAKAYGFDAVQLHGAHGYLINQFLSPLLNRRTDKYGGGIKKRSRFLMEVYRAVRGATGDDYPVMIKLNGSDFVEGGLTRKAAMRAARMLDEEGIDAIEVSGGTSASGKKSPARRKIRKRKQEAYHLPLARKIKKVVKCPVMVVGGYRSYDVVEHTIEKEGIDYVAMSRPLIREPDLAQRWRQGDTSPAKCGSCGGCFKAGLEGGIYCKTDAKEKKRKTNE
jgi:2,4-dienoyl-CoA reductase-like NADH-dependent reductase (Old Yellow Enzyme family)